MISNREYLLRPRTGIIKDINITDYKNNMENKMVSDFYNKEFIVTVKE